MDSAQRTLHTGSSPSRGRGRNSFPGAASTSRPFSNDVVVRVAMYPYVVRGSFETPSHPSRRLTVRNDQLLDLLTLLDDHHLILDIRFPRNGVASPTAITAALTTALATNNLLLPPSPHAMASSVAAGQLHKQPFVLLSPTRRTVTFTFNEHPKINDNNFGFAEIEKLNKNLPNPEPSAGKPKPFVIVAPKYGNIRGPIDSQHFASQALPSRVLSLPHICFAERVLAGFFENLDPRCYEGFCPEDPPSVPLPAATSSGLIRRRSPSESSPERRIRQRQSEPSPPQTAVSILPADVSVPQPPSPGPAFRMLPPPPLPIYPVLRLQDVGPLVVGDNLVSTSDVFSWQWTLQRSAESIVEAHPHPFIMHARSIDDGAAGLWCLLQHMIRSPTVPFPLPDGIIMCDYPESIAQLFRSNRTMRVGTRVLHNGNTGALSIGPGPERAVYRKAVELAVTDHHYWAAASTGMYVPVFSIAPVEIPERCIAFTAYGTLLALHCYYLGQAPLPVSIWILVALTSGREGMLIPTNVLAALDPDAFTVLAPWLTLSPNDPIPTDIFHPLVQFLINVVEIQPSNITSPRTAAVHDEWTRTFMIKVLLTWTVEFFGTPEYLALQRGWNRTVGNTSVVEALVRHQPALSMLACLYDRKVRNLADVVDHLEHKVVRAADDETTPCFSALFFLSVERYLHGAGHPLELRGGVVANDEWDSRHGDPLFRAALLLEACTDSSLRPASQNWRIMFHVASTTESSNGVQLIKLTYLDIYG
ncbi:hypothetical protein FB45DRAFT_64796 [Roridomyces roridus]|uniref:Uncharacterized protein n=1 Tax=Roridomyces roridus TaxID=1738132 RepID=A0AAD7AY50_9AGAR|nr:hypothetical protein FB45DRAFT_64796 [Roridomyces roridus]